MNKQEVIERLNNKLDETFAFQQSFEPLTWAHMECESKANAYMTAINYVEQLDEPQKVKVPQFVAEWIETAKKEKRTLHYSMQDIDDACYYHKGDDPLYRWMFVCDDSSEHQEIFARVWLDGYEVEEEQKYYIQLPVTTWGTYLVKSDDNDLLVWQNTRQGTPFTEQEIKSIDERYWPFAVPVEKV